MSYREEQAFAATAEGNVGTVEALVAPAVDGIPDEPVVQAPVVAPTPVAPALHAVAVPASPADSTPPVIPASPSAPAPTSPAVAVPASAATSTPTAPTLAPASPAAPTSAAPAAPTPPAIPGGQAAQPPAAPAARDLFDPPAAGDLYADPALVTALCPEVPVVVITGHYGVGKTNLALNLALACAQAGFSTTLADLDLVNPYFRSSDYPRLLQEAGIDLIAPVFARTALDTPSVTGELLVAIEHAATDPAHTRLIVDVGGDDVGATALGRFAQGVDAAPHTVLHVVNPFRTLTREPAEAVDILREVEAASHLRVDGIVNNAHLAQETDMNDVAYGRILAAETCELAHLPLTATCVPVHLGDCCDASGDGHEPFVFVARYVTTPW